MNDNSLIKLALIALIISAVAAGYSFVKSDYGYLTGFAATDSATVNLTVETVADINFTVRNISFGSGRVNPGQSHAVLDTSRGSTNVSNGNWTGASADGLRLENVGNVNVSLDLKSAKTAAQFLGGTAPNYMFNVTNLGTVGETAACRNSSGGLDGEGNYNMSLTQNFTTAGNGLRVCGVFQFINTNDTIRIDVVLVVPYDSLKGDLGDVITATATAI